MRRVLLDTTIVAGLLFDRAQIVALVEPWLVRNEAATSILVYAEVIEQIRGRGDYPVRVRSLRSLLRNISLVSVTFEVAERYALIRRSLRPPYGPGLIGDIDTVIAASAIVRDLTLVTADSDFQRVPDLRAQYITLQR